MNWLRMTLGLRSAVYGRIMNLCRRGNGEGHRAVMGNPVSKTTPVPMPADWAKIQSVLERARLAVSGDTIPAPPVPLILGGAAFSTASAIRARWVELVEWANEWGFSGLLASSLPPPPDFDVAENIAGVTENGRG
jgi:hypothetical protein